jgi:hypothetical protein
MMWRVIVAVLVLTGCEATLESQARDTFSDAFVCTPERVDVASARKVVDDVSYAVVLVEGCGRRVKYVCASDWTIGCVSPKRARGSPTSTSPGTSFPPTLVDQTPLPPPPTHEEEGE